MEIEHLFRSTALAVGLKPPAMECEARLRGRERIISSKTICSDKRDLPTAQQSALITDGRRNGPRFASAAERRGQRDALVGRLNPS